MPSHVLVQGSSTLYRVNLANGAETALTLPTGVTLSTTRKPKFATLNQWAVLVNSPTMNLSIDPEGIVRPLTLRPPLHPPTMAAGASTGLTGAYKYRTSFVILNSDGELLSESPLSPESVSVTLADNNASLTDIATSLDTITSRRLYRTASGGTSYFQLMDVEGNSATALIENISDARLSLLPAQPSILDMPPGARPGVRFKNIVEWRSRLWAVADEPDLVDTIYVSETNKVYAWPNTVVAHPTGEDKDGVVAFAPRRNELGLLKKTGVWRIGASSGSTGVSLSNISISQVSVGKAGCVAPDSVVVVNNVVYWLGKDGVYEWSDQGIQNISNDSVRAWFQTDTYFNRDRFTSAFARYNELRDHYELHLANTGDSVENRWVSFNLRNRKWYGPHRTSLFNPTHAGQAIDANSLPISLVGGSDGILYTANSTNFRDGAATAIAFDATTPFYNLDAPDIQHYWGELSMLSRVESGGALTITPTVGGLDVSAGAAITHTLTTGRERLRRIGTGRLMRLNFAQSTVNQGCSLFGFELEVHELGRR